ncbi:MAG: SapC family protein [Alphaproteobacteria bacterium]|nr:SapC family protein [Alphaproteobacteria bacterium]
MSGPNPTSNYGSQADANMPMFYASPRPLDRARDGDLHISRPTHFRFAANTNAIPILIDEFPMAAAHYPIVFAAGPQPVPAAVVGLKNDVNMFIDENGQWLEGSYLPAYVRRYPFILMDNPEDKQFVLCIDEKSDMLASEGEFALFNGDEPSDFTKGAMEFCAALRQQGDATDEFVKALQEYGLLTDNDAQIAMPDGARLQLSGFQIVDPKKFDQLPDNIYLQWRRKGWIGLIYAHHLSSHLWPKLVAMAQGKTE